MIERLTRSPLVLSRDPQGVPKQEDWKTLLLPLDFPFRPLPLDDDDDDAPPRYALLPLDPISPLKYHSQQNATRITSLAPRSFNLSDLKPRGITFTGN
jgi:hypothetical protein